MVALSRFPRLPGAATSPPNLLILVILTGTSVMAMNMVLPVLPQMARDLDVSPAAIQLVLTVFLFATGAAALVVGPLADRYGRRPVLLVTSIIYLGATTLAWFAPNLEILLLARLLQASTAASMSISRAIIRDLYDRSQAASMIGYMTMAMAIMPMVAPTIGGILGEAYGWRSIFLLLDVVALSVLALIWFRVGETHTPVAVSVSAQARAYAALLREPVFWGYIICAAAASGAYFAFLGGAPFVGDKIIGMTPSVLGFHFAFVAIGYMAGNFISGRYSQSVGIERMMMLGGITCAFGVAISLGLMSTLEPKAGYLFYPMMLVGVGNGMALPNSTAGALSVRPDLAGSASGIAGFVQIGAGAALATLSGTLITVENGAMPLYVIMFATSVLGAAVAWLMYRRARRLGGAAMQG